MNPLAPPVPLVDHLLDATPDVDATVDELERRLGVRADLGGRHASWGTRNALLSLGRRSYLEIIGPDAEPIDPAWKPPRPLDIDTLAGPRLATWVAPHRDLCAIVRQAAAAGVDLGAVESRSRHRPDGVRLAWRMTDLLKPRLDGLVPFFIDWGDMPHPAASAPGGCRLAGLRAEHPEAERVEAALGALGLDLPVSAGAAPRLVARLDTPNGIVELG